MNEPAEQKKLLKDHIARYDFAVQFILNKVVLDAGCGHGYGDVILSKYAKKVVGIDIEQIQIEYAKLYCQRPNIEYMLGDITRISAKSEFDVAIAFEVIEHLEKEEQHVFLKSIQRAVKPGGIIIISTPDVYVTDNLMAMTKHLGPDHIGHKHELNYDQFYSLMSEYFTSIVVYGQRPVIPVSKFRRIVRYFLNLLKKADVFNLRKLFPKNFRNNIDHATTLVDLDGLTPVLLSRGNSAEDIIIVAKNDKIKW